MQKGHKRVELLQADNKAAVIGVAKSKFPGSMIIKAIETNPPLEVVISNFMKNIKKSAKKKIPVKDKISTIRQIAVMTDAGIPINDTLADVADNTENKDLKEIYGVVVNDINSGRSFTDAMSKYGDDFGHVAIAMTDLGERTGNISGAYHKLSDILEDIRDNTAKFKKGIRSPLITLAAMGIAFTILIMVVVPKFKEMFDKFETELPLPTLILLGLEKLFNNYGLYFLAFIFIMVNTVKYLYKNNPNVKLKIDTILLHPKFYLINKVIFLSTMHKYTLVFGELVKAGIPVAEALDTAVGMVDNSLIKNKLLTVNANIGRGMSLAEAYAKTGLFENMLLQMIKAGEAGGQLDAMLDKVTEYYNMSFQDIIDNLSTYIEPIMMFFIAGLVLLMALGIFMPMWDLGKAAS
ncbi:Type II secretion system protein [hydrothermal vent metagenome]|uniref:Type II secretion system protein n=1 Tax=hydrothermal vent metagenome TaxID=652676 RepID=A0A1W1BI65_9ZZZZ